jgi:adhesin transport system outer membrane protein
MRLLLCGVALIALTLPIAAQAESLESAVTTALKYHPSIEAARAGRDVAAQETREQNSAYYPEVSFNAAAGRIYGDNATSRGLSVTRGAGYSDLGEGSITMRQLVFDGKETTHKVEAAETREMQAGSTVMNVRESLSLRTAQAYIDVMRARTGLVMLIEHRKKVTDYLAKIDNMVTEGAADEAELQQARDVQVILDGYINDFQGQVRAAEAHFAEVTGHIPEKELERPSPRADLIPPAPDEALQYARSSHPSIIEAELNSRAASYDTDAQKSSLLPEVESELSYYKSSKADVIGGEVIDARALLKLNWGFSLGGAELARVERSKYAHRETLADMGALVRQVERDIRLAYSEYQTAQRQLELLGQRMDLNSKLFDTYETQFEGARITQLQLMQADNQYFNARLEKMNGEHRLLMAQFAVLASMGRLQESLSIAALDQDEQD